MSGPVDDGSPRAHLTERTGEALPLTSTSADWLYRAMMRDLRLQTRNGLAMPPFAEEVLRWLAGLADRPEPTMSSTRQAIAILVPGGHDTYVSVAEAADLVGVTGRTVQRLARSGEIRARRLGNRTWLVDIGSLQNVLRKKAS